LAESDEDCTPSAGAFGGKSGRGSAPIGSLRRQSVPPRGIHAEAQVIRDIVAAVSDGADGLANEPGFFTAWKTEVYSSQSIE
jgi:hypothetical protein